MNKLRKDIIRYALFRGLLKKFIVPVSVLVMLDRGVTVEQIGIILAVGYVVSIILEIPSGAVADTLGHKKTLVLSMIGQGLSMALYLGGTFWWFFAAVVSYKFFSSFMTGTMSALMYERLEEVGEEKQYHKVVGRSKGIGHFLNATALLFTSMAYLWHWWLPFVIGVLHFFLGAIAIAGFTQAKKTVSVKKMEGFWEFVSHFPTAMRQVRDNGLVMWLIILQSFILGLGLGSSQFHQVLYENIGLAVVLFGLAYSLKRYTQIFAYTTLHKITKKISLPGFLWITGLSVSFYFLLIPFLTESWMIMVVPLLASIGYAFSTVGIDGYINNEVSTGSRATTLSIAKMSSSFIFAIVSVSIGFFSNVFPIENIFGVMGIILLIILSVGIPKVTTYFKLRMPSS